MLIRKLKGRGGDDDDGAQGAKEAPDTLASKQYLNIVDLITEGPAFGLANNLQSIIVGGTPIMNPDGSKNIDGFNVHGRNGTVNQTHVPGFSAAESEKMVGVQIKKASPITRTLEGRQLDAARVTVSIPSLQVIYADGSNDATHVEIAISVQENGGGYVPQYISIAKVGEGAAMFTSSSETTLSTKQNTQKVGICVYWQGTPSPSLQKGIFAIQRSIKGANNFVHVTEYAFEGKAELKTILYGSGPYQSGNSWYQPPEQTFFFYDNVDEAEYDYRIANITVTNTRPPKFNVEKCELWLKSLTDRIYGICTTKYAREYTLKLNGPGPYDIRVTRVTDDSTSSYLQNDISWETFTEITYAKFRYPYSAYIALSVDSSLYDGIPSRAYDVKGLLVNVPYNYDPDTRTYSGVWDFATFKTAYTDNPAWCLYDLITNSRYGLGKYVNRDTVNKASFYKIAQYCDEMVPDGYGGMEPRFRCSLYIQGKESAFKVLNDMASVFNGLLYWSGGTVQTAADMPENPAWLFSNANVVNGEFIYEGSSRNTRYTVALVTYADEKDRYTEKVEYVEDPDGIAKYGVKTVSLVAVGATSRGQARRYGANILLTSRLLTETVSFTTGIEGAGSGIVPGSIIKVQDANRAGKRYSGRILSATSNSVTIDHPIDTILGESYTLSVILPSGAVQDRQITFSDSPVAQEIGDNETDIDGRLAIEDSSGQTIGSYLIETTHTVLNFITPFTETPQRMSIWMFQADTLQPQLFRVISITEKDVCRYQVTALEYNPSKFSAIDNGTSFLEIPTNSNDRWVTPAPTGLTLTEEQYLDDKGNLSTRVLVRVDAPSSPYFRHHVLQWRYSGGAWQPAITYQTNFASIENVARGTIEVSVQAVNQYKIASNKVYGSLDVGGDITIPPDVDNFLLNIRGGNAYFTWSVPDNLASKNISHFVIRHTPEESSSAAWGASAIVTESVLYPLTSTILPVLSGTYLIKAVSKQGNESANAALIINEVDDSNDFTVLYNRVENPYYTGEKTHLTAGGGKLYLSGEVMLDWTPLTSADPLKGIPAFSSGEYMMQSLTLPEVFTVRLTSIMRVIGTDTSKHISQWSNLSDVQSLSGVSNSDWSAIVYYRKRNRAEDPWSDWMQLSSTEVSLQYAEFKLVLESYVENVSPEVSYLAIRVEAKNRVEGKEDVVSNAVSGVSHVVYANPFYSSPAVAIVAQDMNSLDWYEVYDKDEYGFYIKFYNGSNEPVSRMFDWVAKGFGKSYGVGGTKRNPLIPSGGYE